MDPIRLLTDGARQGARQMLAQMRHAVLAVNDPASGHPHLSKIACQAGPDGIPVALLSGLAVHSRALAADPRAGLLVEIRQDRGDPMTWPRLSLQVEARPVAPAEDEALRRAWVARDPKAAVYARLGDFRLWRMQPRGGLLNAGFGRAYRLGTADLGFRSHDERPGD